jgi:hypothetical protein
MMGATSNKFLRLSALLVASALGYPAVWAQSPDLPKPAGPSLAPADDPSTSLESLLQTKVVTASRFSENLADARG